jgi:hypothetical protein
VTVTAIVGGVPDQGTKTAEKDAIDLDRQKIEERRRRGWKRERRIQRVEDEGTEADRYMKRGERRERTGGGVDRDPEMTEIVGKSILAAAAAANRLKKSPARNPDGIEVIRKKKSINLSRNVCLFSLYNK